MIDIKELIFKYYENIYGKDMVRSVSFEKEAAKINVANVQVRSALQSKDCGEIAISFQQLVNIIKDAVLPQPEAPNGTASSQREGKETAEEK